VLRILIETPLDLDLERLLQQASDGLSSQIDATKTVPEVFDYIMERLKSYYTEQSIPADSVEAVMARRPTRPADFDQRVHAVSEFRKLPAAESLAAANKRIRNILKKTDQAIADAVDVTKLEDQAERLLFDRITDMAIQVRPMFAAGDYAEGLQLLAGLKAPVDGFFDQVMVMAEDPQLRSNRLALLSQLENLFLSVADLSRLQ
jgi:glycyl-tRNA synthetase beta chain